MPCGALTSFLRRSLLLYNFLAVDDIQPFGLIFQRAVQFLTAKAVDALLNSRVEKRRVDARSAGRNNDPVSDGFTLSIGEGIVGRVAA